MDAKSSDDSLDTSLQQKCVVDDSSVTENIKIEGHDVELCKINVEDDLRNTTATYSKTQLQQKTDTDPCGDNISSSSSNNSNNNGSINNCSILTVVSGRGEGGGDGNIRDDSCNAADQEPTKTCTATTTTVIANNTAICGVNLCNTESAMPPVPPNDCNTTIDNVSTNFESKVKQISQDLMETTLCEESSEELTEELKSTSSSNSASSLPTTPDDEHASLESNSAQNDNSADSAILNDEVSNPDDVCSSNINESIDEEHEARAKRVRFHPDAKENDGGNPVKKKRLLQKADNDTDYDMKMELDNGNHESCEQDMIINEKYDYGGGYEDEDNPQFEEEEFDLAKTIAEAENYLKEHPLSFVRPNEQTGEKLKDGLLNIEDETQITAESSDDEDFYTTVVPENGVQCVLGKQIKGGKVEFLLRYVNQPGLHWESDEVLCNQCPTLLRHYELHRQARQERLMRHVARRQNLRQRYTDF